MEFGGFLVVMCRYRGLYGGVCDGIYDGNVYIVLLHIYY